MLGFSAFAWFSAFPNGIQPNSTLFYWPQMTLDPVRHSWEDIKIPMMCWTSLAFRALISPINFNVYHALCPYKGINVKFKNATWCWQWAHVVICTYEKHYLRWETVIQSTLDMNATYGSEQKWSLQQSGFKVLALHSNKSIMNHVSLLI